MIPFLLSQNLVTGFTFNNRDLRFSLIDCKVSLVGPAIFGFSINSHEKQILKTRENHPKNCFFLSVPDNSKNIK